MTSGDVILGNVTWLDLRQIPNLSRLTTLMR